MFTPVQKQLVSQMVDSALQEHGLDEAQVHPGHQLAWRHMGVTIVPGEWSHNRTIAGGSGEDEHHLYKKVGGNAVEDTLQPGWFGGKDWFERNTRSLGEEGYQAWEDPSGLWQDNPLHREPWEYAKGGHWDEHGPEAPDVGWEEAEGRELEGRAMRHGTHHRWKDLPNPQWGWQHQFADWDPDSSHNAELEFGHASAHTATPPWELSFLDPRLYGDDFVPKAQTRAEYKGEENNQFADWEVDGRNNQDLVFGHHSPLKLHTHTPVSRNWNAVTDSQVPPDEAARRLGMRGADISSTYPDEGSPASRFFSEWDTVPSQTQHVVWDAGSEHAPLADKSAEARAGSEEAGAGGEEHTPDQKRGFQ